MRLMDALIPVEMTAAVQTAMASAKSTMTTVAVFMSFRFEVINTCGIMVQTVKPVFPTLESSRRYSSPP